MFLILCYISGLKIHHRCLWLPLWEKLTIKPHDCGIGLGQGSSTFQIVRATLTIAMMPAGHKPMTYMYT
jgi:hypothetical protein